MNKLLTKIVLILLTLTTLLCFASCNTPSEGPVTEAPTDPTGTVPPGGDEETPTTGPDNGNNGDEEGPDLPTQKYDGEFKVYIRGWGSEGFDYTDELFVGYTLDPSPSSLDRAVYERMILVQDKYGVIFDVLSRDDGTDKSVVDTSAKTGTDVFDLLVDHGVHTFGYAQKNLLLDYAKLPYVDTSNPWWNQNMQESFRTAGGKLFAMTGDIGYYSMGSTFAMFFNKDIIADIPSLASPYEKVRADEWTFETFEEYVTIADSNMNGDNSGDLVTDSFGYGTAEWRGPVQAFYSTGERTVIRKNNEWRITVNKDICNRVFFDYRDLLFNSGVAYLKRAVDYADLRSAFISDRVCFFDDNLQAASYFKGSDLNFGLLPWPKYNDEVEEYYSAVDAGTNVYSVLRNTTQANAERVSVVIEALAYYGYRDIMPFYYDTILSYQYLKDRDAIDMLHIIHDNLVFDLGYFLGNTISGVFRTAVISKDGSASLSTAVDENLGSAEEQLKAWDALDKEE